MTKKLLTTKASSGIIKKYSICHDPLTQRPTSIYLTGSRSLTLQYSGATQRVLKNYNDGSVTNSKLYLHGQNAYPLLEKDRTSAAAENLAIYIYGLNGAIAKRSGATVLFLLKDHLGSTRVVMDATGLVHTYYDYDALGNLIRTGTTNEVTYQFTGQEYDESGLHNYRARLYDSDLGKFYAMDPDGEFASPFIYAGNYALRYTDPTGRFITFAAFAFYAIQTYKYASYAYMAYNLVHATQQGGFGGFVQAAISMGAGATVGGAASGLIGSGSLAGSVASGAIGGAAGGAASAYVMGGNVGTNALMGAASGGVTGALSYGARVYDAQLAQQADFKASGYGGYGDRPVEHTDKAVGEFIQKNSRLRLKYIEGGTPSVTAAWDDLPGAKINWDTGNFETIDPTTGGPESAVAFTRPDLKKPIALKSGLTGYRSDIFLAPSATMSASRLYFTLGHEFTHSMHWSTGLRAAWGLDVLGARISEGNVRMSWDIPHYVQMKVSAGFLAKQLINVERLRAGLPPLP